MVDHVVQRRGVSLKLGARIGLVLAVLMLVFAAFHLWAPVDITGRGGLQFDCGSVIDPPSGPLQVANCGRVVDRQRMIVIFTGIGALVVAAGSIYAFGMNRRRETYPPATAGRDDDVFASGGPEHY